MQAIMRTVHDADLNHAALIAFEALGADAIRPLLSLTGVQPSDLHDIVLDGTQGAFLVTGDRFETAINLYWNWDAGDDSLSDERSGTACGRIVDGAPVIESVRVAITL